MDMRYEALTKCIWCAYKCGDVDHWQDYLVDFVGDHAYIACNSMDFPHDTPGWVRKTRRKARQIVRPIAECLDLHGVKPKGITITGYGPGGSLAAAVHGPLEVVTGCEIDCITFGAPRVLPAGQTTGSRHFRVISFGDPLPWHVPVWESHHCGRAIGITKDGKCRKVGLLHTFKHLNGHRVRQLKKEGFLHEYLQRLHRARLKTTNRWGDADRGS